jgi:hypothetical protein
MILMEFLTTQTARLVIGSVAVSAFSIFMAIATAAPEEVLLSATAAYAAVMVVYVGTASPGV